MTYGRAWVLLLAWLPLAWAVWEWHRSARRAGLVLKAVSLAAILLALADPRLVVFETKVATVVLADTSASASAQDLARASRIATEIENARGRHWTRVIPFARTPRNPAEEERPGGWQLRPTAGEAGRATNLEAALREAAASMPAGMVPRIALVSDGHENAGSVVRAAWQARQFRIPVDTFPLAGRPKPKLGGESVSFPSRVFSGERFPIDVTLTAPAGVRAPRATVEITADGKPLGSSAVDLAPGVNRVRVHATVSAAGAVDVAGKISSPELGEARFEQAVTLRRPKLLLVTQDPPDAERHLNATLAANQFEVTRTNTSLPADLGEFQLIVFNNWDFESVSLGRKSDLERFVKEGGGLLWIGGERNVWVEKASEDALDRALPAKIAPPRTPEGTCVVLIVDKSSSME
ncbi:MAG: VWA domain-containing protein, partial [Bryobacteraceae bacterium]